MTLKGMSVPNGAKIGVFESCFCGSAELRPPFPMPLRKLEGESVASRQVSNLEL